ncbi:hypothetical protein VNI00_018609 [Paramarasmius palmivorus]|uniref:Uncharacterized protein n=1 Tax=Paramarasmius palmivorus TaxID=297713 RepID=A0AAW0AWW4_9AGAR
MKTRRRTPSPWSSSSLNPPAPPSESSELPRSSPPPDERSESPVSESWSNEDLTAMLIDAQEKIAEQASLIEKYESEKAAMKATFSRRLVDADHQVQRASQAKIKSLEREFAWSRRCLLDQIRNLKEVHAEAEEKHTETVSVLTRAQSALVRQAESLQRELNDLKTCSPQLWHGQSQGKHGKNSAEIRTTVLKGPKRIRDVEDQVENGETSRKRQRM